MSSLISWVTRARSLLLSGRSCEAEHVGEDLADLGVELVLVHVGVVEPRAHLLEQLDVDAALQLLDPVLLRGADAAPARLGLRRSSVRPARERPFGGSAARRGGRRPTVGRAVGAALAAAGDGVGGGHGASRRARPAPGSCGRPRAVRRRARGRPRGAVSLLRLAGGGETIGKAHGYLRLLERRPFGFGLGLLWLRSSAPNGRDHLAGEGGGERRGRRR